MGMGKIVGACSHCGSCCLYGDAIKYNVYQHRGSNKSFFVFDKVNKKKIRTIKPCSYLTYDIETRKAICNCYDKRPSLCRQYPYRKEEMIFPLCTYLWIDI